MPPAQRALRTVQYGVEANRGTPVAATRQLQANTMAWDF